MEVAAVQSDFLNALDVVNSEPQPPPFFDAKILDGTAVVHFLPPKNATTFEFEFLNFLFKVQ
jgi:hypothetical protein